MTHQRKCYNNKTRYETVRGRFYVHSKPVRRTQAGVTP